MKLRSALQLDLAEARSLESKLRVEVYESIQSRRSATNDEFDDPEGSNLAFEGAQSNAMLQHTSRHSAEIIAALGRLEDGSYGTCGRCYLAISIGRLEARPSSAYCIFCAA